MAEQMRPASPEDAPDPSNNSERSHPERESVMGRLENEKATPQEQPDSEHQAVHNKQEPRQVNDHELGNRAAPEQPDHSMKDEEPDGWDQAPTDITEKRQKRHPRTDGKGGTP